MRIKFLVILESYWACCSKHCFCVPHKKLFALHEGDKPFEFLDLQLCNVRWLAYIFYKWNYTHVVNVNIVINLHYNLKCKRGRSKFCQIKLFIHKKTSFGDCYIKNVPLRIIWCFMFQENYGGIEPLKFSPYTIMCFLLVELAWS
jgi:hypothetical protein